MKQPGRLRAKPFYLEQVAPLTFRQKVALLFGARLHIRFDCPNSICDASCHLSWGVEKDGQTDWMRDDNDRCK